MHLRRLVLCSLGSSLGSRIPAPFPGPPVPTPAVFGEQGVTSVFVTLLSQPGSALPPPQLHKDIPHPSRKQDVFSFLSSLARPEHFVLLPPGPPAFQHYCFPTACKQIWVRRAAGSLLVNSFTAKLGLVSRCSHGTQHRGWGWRVGEVIPSSFYSL